MYDSPGLSHSAWFSRPHLWSLLTLAAPNVLVSVLSNSLVTIDLALAGYVSPAALSGAALGTALMAMTGLVILNGLCSAVDTLCTQSYGAGQHKMVGLHAWRAALAFSLPMLPIIGVWCFTERICLMLGMPAETAVFAGQYVLYAAPSLPAQLYTQIARRYLSSQRIVGEQVWPLLAANIVQLVVGYVLVIRGGLGLVGVGIAFSIGMWALLVSYLLYIYAVRRAQIGQRFCPRIPSRWRALLTGWGELWELGIPGAWLLAFKWSAMEVVLVQAGWLGPLNLAVFVVIKSLSGISFQLGSGLGIASHTLVGNAVGAGRPAEARMLALATHVASMGAAAVEMGAVLLLNKRLALAYSRDPALLAEFGDMWWLLLLVLPADTLQGTAIAILRGVGRQADSTLSNGLAHVGFGLPLGYILAFPAGGYGLGWGLEGLIAGYVIGTIVAAAALLWITARLDWVELSEEATERRRHEKEELLAARQRRKDDGGASAAARREAALIAKLERPALQLGSTLPASALVFAHPERDDDSGDSDDLASELDAEDIESEPDSEPETRTRLDTFQHHSKAWHARDTAPLIEHAHARFAQRYG